MDLSVANGDPIASVARVVDLTVAKVDDQTAMKIPRPVQLLNRSTDSIAEVFEQSATKELHPVQVITTRTTVTIKSLPKSMSIALLRNDWVPYRKIRFLRHLLLPSLELTIKSSRRDHVLYRSNTISIPLRSKSMSIAWQQIDCVPYRDFRFFRSTLTATLTPISTAVPKRPPRR